MSTRMTKSQIIEEGNDLNIKFDVNMVYRLGFSDFISASLSGNLSKDVNILKNKNFLYSKLSEFKMEGLCFLGCDFLDSIIDNCQFINCDLSGQHFTSSKLYRTTFDTCKIAETNYQSSIFEHCLFVNCEFTNILMKTCTFINCKFINCKTSNKLFESCLLLDCHFDYIELQLQTIYDNFGLCLGSCGHVNFRDKRKREEYNLFAIDEIKDIDVDELKDVLHQFNYNYFNHQMSIESYDSLFSLIEKPNWLLQGASSSIINKVENLTSFLLHLYDNDEIIFLPIIKLSDLVKASTNHVEEIRTIEAKKLVRCLYGVNHDLSSYIGTFLNKVNFLVQCLDFDDLVLEGYGPLDASHYQMLFEHLGSDVNIISVEPKNSPNFIKCSVKYVAIWALVSLVLTTQYKHSIEAVADSNFMNENELAKTSKKIDEQLVGNSPDNIGNLSSYKLTIGPLGTGDEIGFQAVSVFSNGMVETLKLGISAKRALELQSTIIGFAQASPAK